MWIGSFIRLGSEDDQLHVELDSCQIRVTRNLHAALKRLRFSDRPRTLWVDAICINQADNEEKSHQIALMGEIYGKTTRGIIFLGEELEADQNETLDERQQLHNFFAGRPPPGLEPLYEQFMAIRASASSDALEAVNNAIGRLPRQSAPRDNIIHRTRACVWHGDDRDIHILRQANHPSFQHDSIFHAFCLLRRLAMDVHPSEMEYFAPRFGGEAWYPSEAIRALKWLGERSWWKRIWTVQECILPEQCVVVHGPVQAPWSMFHEAMSNLHRHLISCCASVPGISEALSSFSVAMSQIRDIQTSRRQRRGISLATLLTVFKYRQATKTRDKVYGLLGLVTDWGTAGPNSIIPDYTLTSQQVFTQTTAAVIQSTRSLAILCQPGNMGIDYSTTLPSWVVDYSLPVSALGMADRYQYQIPLYKADRGRPADVRVIDERILVLDAVRINSLRECYEAADAGYREPQSRVLRQWWDKASQERRLPWDWRQRFWRALCGDTVVGSAATYRRARPDDEQLFNTWWSGQGLSEVDTWAPPTAGGWPLPVAGRWLPPTVSGWPLPAAGGWPFPVAGGWSSPTVGGWPHPLANRWPPPTTDRGFLARDPGNPVKSVEPAIKAATAQRKFFVSDKGYIGLAPNTAGRDVTALSEKEEIFVIPGGRTPFLLRPVGEQYIPGVGMRRNYRFLGDCYVQGFMDDEAMEDFERTKETIYLV